MEFVNASWTDIQLMPWNEYVEHLNWKLERKEKELKEHMEFQKKMEQESKNKKRK